MSGTIQRLFGVSNRIDDRLAELVSPIRPTDFVSFSKDLPSYRYVDLYEASEFCTTDWSRRQKLESQHTNIDLTSLLTGDIYRSHLLMRRSEQKAWPVGPDRDRFLPVDVFWIQCGPGPTKTIVRLSDNEYSSRAKVEVASNDAARAEACLKAIVDRSEKHSIMRGAVLRLSYEAGSRDEYGDVEKQESLRIVFVADDDITAEDLIIDDDTRAVLSRNVVDLFTRRETLKASGVPIKRGILLYGPPGTGKTYACRHLCRATPSATRIFVTGSALTQVGAIFSAARMLQPCLLLLEDVDLAFSAREVNLFNSGLADLLDHLDGVRPNDDICVVMTTNSLDRMESAIKDRPGRVSQCVFMDNPTCDLRRRYLKRYLRDFDASRLDLDTLAEMSDGVSQAFLKEWIFRAVQIASEDEADGCARTVLLDADFKAALNEMKSFIDGVGARIIGFTARERLSPR